MNFNYFLFTLHRYHTSWWFLEKTHTIRSTGPFTAMHIHLQLYCTSTLSSDTFIPSLTILYLLSVGLSHLSSGFRLLTSQRQKLNWTATTSEHGFQASVLKVYARYPQAFSFWAPLLVTSTRARHENNNINPTNRYMYSYLDPLTPPPPHTNRLTVTIIVKPRVGTLAQCSAGTRHLWHNLHQETGNLIALSWPFHFHGVMW